MAERFDLLDMDDTRKPAPTSPASAQLERPLDMIDDVKSLACVECGAVGLVDDASLCRSCYEKQHPEPQLATGSGPVTTSTSDAFADIASNAAANASAPMLGDMAQGRASLGVGYTSAEGYIEALRRGAARATVDSYASTLRRTYKRTVSVSYSGTRYTVSIDEGKSTHTTFDAALMQLQSGDGSSGIDSHANDDAIANIKRTAAARKSSAAKVKSEQQTQTLASAPVIADVAPVALVHGQLVAGAAAEGHGVLIGWTGSGDMTRAEMLTRLDGAKLPREWAFDAKDAGVQLTRAVRTVSAARYNCEQEKKKDAQIAEAREWSSRWMLVSKTIDGDAAKVGNKFGEIALVVTLYSDKPEPELVFDEGGDAGLIEAVKQEFAARIGAERYVAADITKWLWTTLKAKCAAVKYGGNWYVPRKHRGTAESLVAAFKTWGADWMDPPLPIASTSQLAQGLANGLQREVDEELRKLEAQRANAREKANDQSVDVGEKAASSFMLRLRQIGERVCSYEQLLGVDMMSECQTKIRKAMQELSSLIEGAGTVERFAQVWSEIEFDIKRTGGAL